MEKNKVEVLEVSAKTGENHDVILKSLITKIMRRGGKGEAIPTEKKVADFLSEMEKKKKKRFIIFWNYPIYK